MRSLSHVVALLIPAFSVFAQAAPSRESKTIKVKVIDNLIVMPAYVNASRRLNVVLDTGTGASLNILTPDCASELNLTTTSSIKAAGIGRGQDETLHLVPNARLFWGPNRQFSLNHQRIAVLPITYISQSEGYPVDGIFGSSLFAHFDVRVDYERNTVTFSRGRRPSGSGTAIPIKLYGSTPFVQAKIETAGGKAVPGLFLVDSGTTGALILSSKFLAAHTSIAQGHSYYDVPSTTAVGGAIDMRVLRVTGLDLGPFRLRTPVAAVPPEARGVLAVPGLAGFIGADILSRFTVDWDYARKTVTLTPNRRYGKPFGGDTTGLKLVAEKPDWKTIRVETVRPGSPAAEAGFEPGDILLKVDGKRPPQLYALNKFLGSHPGTSVSLTVLRSGKTQTITIHLCRLF
jgi:PDZ domain